MRAAAAAVGLVFGFTLAWSGMSDPDVIRRGLLFEDLYLFGLFLTALVTASAGVHLLRRVRARALVTGERIGWETLRPERRHIVGSIVFGLGWSISAACPGPIAAQLGGGLLWSVPTIAGVALGIKLYLVRGRAAARVPTELPVPVS
ncbi:MAG: YeeE/YedE family protein [Actinobacteria bacterium]|nr:YeeE/YedE family protein [Actinomycetota bacterium]